MTKIIDSFSGEFRFLSNFYESPIQLHTGSGLHSYSLDFATSEHLYQWFKTDDEKYRDLIRMAHSPGHAKRLGQECPTYDNWDEIKLEIMFSCIQLKFTQNSDLGDALLLTKDFELVEGNTWGDTFWGVCDGVGQNWLGRILMLQRSALIKNG